ncbi:MAG: LL-diaminopimelate aminotransferase, partial [Bacteroidales bacterium]|nr:LL-diaminopimelate aminotransferase [Bacteroidales bacterium]
MACINNNFLKIHESYLFTEIAHKVAEYKVAHPDASVISLGIGDVTRPLCPTVIQALHNAVNEMANPETFKGYGPEHGYKFLIQTIIQHDYNSRGISLAEDEVFISD